MLGIRGARRVFVSGFPMWRRNASSSAVQELLKGYQTVEEREVDWSTMDAFQHVNNAQYVRWFEVARITHLTDLIRISGESTFLSPKGVGPILKDIYTLLKVRTLIIDPLH